MLHHLESVGQFYAKSAAILLNGILQVKIGDRIVICFAQQIIDAGGNIQIFDEVLAKDCEIDDGIARDIRPRHSVAEV